MSFAQNLGAFELVIITPKEYAIKKSGVKKKKKSGVEALGWLS